MIVGIVRQTIFPKCVQKIYKQEFVKENENDIRLQQRFDEQNNDFDDDEYNGSLWLAVTR